MLTRIAKVVWWLGLGVALLGTFFYLQAAYERNDCAAALQLQAELNKATDAAVARYEREHPASLGEKPDVVAWLDAFSHTRADPRDTPALRDKVTACKYPDQSGIGLTVFWVLALILWTLAYILGGSFWLPSKRRT